MSAPVVVLGAVFLGNNQHYGPFASAAKAPRRRARTAAFTVGLMGLWAHAGPCHAEDVETMLSHGLELRRKGQDAEALVGAQRATVSTGSAVTPVAQAAALSAI